MAGLLVLLTLARTMRRSTADNVAGEIIAGIQEFVVGNTFGATAFVIYGGFWFSLGAVYMPGLGIIGKSRPVPSPS